MSSAFAPRTAAKVRLDKHPKAHPDVHRRAHRVLRRPRAIAHG